MAARARRDRRLYEMAERLDRRIMVRLVKGAYWDTEIKRAQVEGLADFPVFTRKAATDVSYIGCARKLLGMTDRHLPAIRHPQRPHLSPRCWRWRALDREASSSSACTAWARRCTRSCARQAGTRCRIYAPVGAHRDLLAYLVRRLLENGANSSFVNQIVDESVPPRSSPPDPFAALGAAGAVRAGGAHPARSCSAPGAPQLQGLRPEEPASFAASTPRAPLRRRPGGVGPILAGPRRGRAAEPNATRHRRRLVGRSRGQPRRHRDRAGAPQWWDAPVAERAAVLRRAADLYERDFGEIFALLAREAGKTLLDGVADCARRWISCATTPARPSAWRPRLADPARGVFTCISPWNFPLAIFTGQIAAALAAGNARAGETGRTDARHRRRAAELLREAGVPRRHALQLLPGDGPTVGGPR
jgi:RHH-type proline utilization regulon transcriptional repressor/proline dehydrogenase/delta 1-pyrroline-5-carboxylate dehydrogenase